MIQIFWPICLDKCEVWLNGRVEEEGGGVDLQGYNFNQSFLSRKHMSCQDMHSRNFHLQCIHSVPATEQLIV